MSEEFDKIEETNEVEDTQTTEDITSPSESVEVATPTTEELLAQEKDKYMRLYADFENFKKRTSKEKMDFFQYANQDMMISMLDVLDDFERALKQINKEPENNDIQGIELIFLKLKSKLTEKGLKMIETKAGDDFSVDLHEAITQIPAPNPDLKGKIIDVIEAGYELHSKVIRFAKVVIGN